MSFSLTSEFKPTGDQPKAIKSILDSFNTNQNHVTLQGVTGSGKTFTVANVIQEIKKPTLVLAHNKTLAAQLYSEFQSFFPNNAVEYFVSYYDYYQPEAYIPSSGLYIEKDLSINEQIEKYRLSATSSLLSGRDDIIVVASVSCIYGIGNPSEFKKHVIQISIDDEIQISNLLTLFVKSQYSRSINELNRGSFSVKGDVVDIFPSYSDIYYRINFFGDTIESIESIDPLSGNKIENFEKEMQRIRKTTGSTIETSLNNELSLCLGLIYSSNPNEYKEVLNLHDIKVITDLPKGDLGSSCLLSYQNLNIGRGVELSKIIKHYLNEIDKNYFLQKLQ